VVIREVLACKPGSVSQDLASLAG